MHQVRSHLPSTRAARSLLQLTVFFYLCNSNFIQPARFFLLREIALTPPFIISDSAYATWMTREASWALEEWTNSYLLTHQHIRASLPMQPSATAEQVHEEGIATLISKLDDQGWSAPPASLTHPYTSHAECRRSYSSTRESPTSHRVLSQMCLYDLSMQMHVIEEAPPPSTAHVITFHLLRRLQLSSNVAASLPSQAHQASLANQRSRRLLGLLPAWVCLLSNCPSAGQHSHFLQHLF
jgi:hypothetical protein